MGEGETSELLDDFSDGSLLVSGCSFFSVDFSSSSVFSSSDISSFSHSETGLVNTFFEVDR
ncbi:hypothetical protein VV11_006005 [Trichodesmium erythraeum 21-75]|nr:hypothetical protein [Trichodesmium erythraeum 21-75]